MLPSSLLPFACLGAGSPCLWPASSPLLLGPHSLSSLPLSLPPFSLNHQSLLSFPSFLLWQICPVCPRCSFPCFLHSLLFLSLPYFSLTTCCPSPLISSSTISLFLFPSGSHFLPFSKCIFLSLLHPFRARARVRSLMHTFKEMPINSVIKIILF